MLLSSPRSRGLRTTHSFNNQMGYMDIPRQSSTNDMHAINPELQNITPNTLYLTFNAPKVDEYHRGLFLTYPPSPSTSRHGDAHPTTSGTLFHAIWKEKDSAWVLEKRIIKDISTSQSLVLLYKIQSIDPNSTANLVDLFNRIQGVLESVPMGRAERKLAYGYSPKGNPVLGGYDCVIWTGDALRALGAEGLIDLRGCDVG
ncbi:hypothetical protein HYFRA_00010901 [Hymenoscyphus fraxineus]|uniref:Uncharacterized protein n=1 Tax=Hymenoscyphus fraxineus TaxID=746836 RepID=A0A9N9KXI7_9HELO|nr:hypothetical protein HYFRA_00010901 [Hymenoscyphus fraxineus]